MHDFYKFLKENRSSALGELIQLHPYMFAKNFVGVDFNFLQEAILVCKAPTHVIKTQSENPDFEIYARFDGVRITSFMIKIFDLKKAPFTIVSHNVPAKNMRKLKTIKSIAFINESDEEILSVEIKPCNIEKAAAFPPTKQLYWQDLLEENEPQAFEKISSSTGVITNNHFVHRETDKNPEYLYKLSEEPSLDGEDDIFGHGPRMEDMIHFHSTEQLPNTQAFHGLSYPMTKSRKGELCDELIVRDGEWAVLIQAKSSVTKQRLRDRSTSSDRIGVTIKRANQAANQLLKHIKFIEEMSYKISTDKGKISIPHNIYGLIIVSETFENKEFFSAYKDMINANPLFKKIKMNILSLSDYIYLLKSSELDEKTFINTLDYMFENNIKKDKFGVLPCCFSISCRLG